MSFYFVVQAAYVSHIQCYLGRKEVMVIELFTFDRRPQVWRQRSLLSDCKAEIQNYDLTIKFQHHKGGRELG